MLIYGIVARANRDNFMAQRFDLECKDREFSSARTNERTNERTDRQTRR